MAGAASCRGFFTCSTASRSGMGRMSRKPSWNKNWLEMASNTASSAVLVKSGSKAMNNFAYLPPFVFLHVRVSVLGAGSSAVACVRRAGLSARVETKKEGKSGSMEAGQITKKG